MERNTVIVVDSNDNALMEMDKLDAHREGVLHRAFSVFIMDDDNRMLIHQRARHKYHSGGLWTNACCSHPVWGEEVMESAHDRLKFEMGMKVDSLNYLFSLEYREDVGSGLVEHEFDHVYVGYSTTMPDPNPDEVENTRWINTAELSAEVAKYPERFTVWFRTLLPMVLSKL